ncbi:MAG: dihydroorotate dehydrogenase [Deltaproteobacteria bacterium]|nr:dihydroorotate dehydrogenase [Deltaproteobacteria bacterium]
MNLAVDLAGLKLKNPIMTASGTFGYGLEFSRYGDLTKLGAIVVKGLSLKPRQGNPMPRIVETPCGMLNAIGLQNVGVEAFVRDKLPFLPWRETPVIANLYAQDVAEFHALARFLAPEEAVAALEVNISCPNVRRGGMAFGQDPAMAAEATRAVLEGAGEKPVIVKLSPNVTDIRAMAQAVTEAGAHVLSLINTLTGMAVDVRTRRPRLANGIGGLSGPAIKPVALRMVREVCQITDRPVIGIGGIVSVWDALEFILVGATAVQVGTGTFMRPDLCFRMVRQLEEAVEELGLESWDEFRGRLITAREGRKS